MNNTGAMLKDRVKAQAKDAVQNAKLFGENFARTNKYMHANKLWLHTVPTTDCEVVVIFPARTDDAVLLWVLAKLKERLPELRVAVRHHAHTGTCGLYLSTTFNNLLKGAEKLAFRKALKHEFGGGLKEFTCLDSSMFEGVDDEEGFLSSQERQAIVYHLLESLRAVEGDRLGKVEFVDNEAIIPKLQSKGAISKVFPLHKHEDLNVLKKTWVTAFLKPQPLDAVCEYFGVKIAMYFAWLGYYTQALLFPAFIGLLLTFYQDDSNKEMKSDDQSVVFFSVFNIIWASLLLEVWKRKGSTLAYRWGTLDSKHELIEDPRPQYKGDLVMSPVSGKLQPYYPAWKRNLFRYFVTLPVIVLCCAVTFASMYVILEFQEWVNIHIAGGDFPGLVGYIPKIILAAVISVSGDIFKKVAYWLNRKENYRLQSMHENQLILKLVTVQFINHFLALFYIAFVLKDMVRLKKTLGTVFILRQLTGNFKEALLPYLSDKLKVYQMTYRTASQVNLNALQHEGDEHDEQTIPDDADGEESGGSSPATPPSSEERFIITQAELESQMHAYEDTFDDYLEMLIQFGYVILFSSAFPMAGACALINNIIEIRSDAFKLCSSMRRPFGQRVENIGSWQQAMEVMSIIGVIVNCALLGTFGYVGRGFPSLSPTGVILFVVVLEHVILAVKTGISMGIPDVPHWVSIEMAKLEYRRRQALKKLEMDALHCAKESKAQDTSTSKEGETDSKKEDGGTTNGSEKPKLKRPQQGKVWPSSMTEAAASFRLFERNGKNDKAVSTDDRETDCEQTAGAVNDQKEESCAEEKSSQDKKCD